MNIVIYVDDTPIYQVINTVADAIAINDKRGYHASVVYVNIAENRLADNTFSADTTKVIQHSMAYIDFRTWTHSFNPDGMTVVLKPIDMGIESECAQSICDEIWEYITYNASYILAFGEVEKALTIECNPRVLADFFWAASGRPLGEIDV